MIDKIDNRRLSSQCFITVKSKVLRATIDRAILSLSEDISRGVKLIDYADKISSYDAIVDELTVIRDSSKECRKVQISSALFQALRPWYITAEDRRSLDLYF